MKTLLMIGSGLIGGALMFQMPATPPMKMGLWESTSTTKMSGADMPQGMTMPSFHATVRSCLTPESYARTLAASQRQKDCAPSNEVWTGKQFSFDIACKSGNTTGHFELTFDSKESGHAVMHMNMNPSKGRPMQMEMTSEMHFISSDCGSVSPDKPEIVR
ncbi:MAG: DUF3617 domain-containing protein [Acidobacteriota bacterium]|nr:DUF3617 domain-containing protein [Acidobacteriota bacterium]